MNILEELKDTLEGRISDWSEADRETAKTVATDLARFQAKILAGETVDPTELAFAKASAKNLATAAVFTGAAAMLEFLERIAHKALGMVNPFMSG